MPKSLSNRLEDLENEIHVLLTLQEPGTGCCSNVVRGASITAQSADGKVDKVVFEGATCCQTKQEGKVKLTLPSGKPKNDRPVSSPEPSRRKHRNSSKGDQPQGDGNYNGERRISSGGGTRSPLTSEKRCCCAQHTKDPSCICGQRRKSALKKCICGPKGSLEPGSITDEDLQGGVDSESRKKSGASEGSGSQPKGSAEDPEALAELQRSAEEQQKAAEAAAAQLKESEDLAGKLKAQLEELQRQLKKSEEEKKKALSASNELKDKYEKLSSGKSSEAKELEKLKKEKEELAKKLEKQEEQRRNLEEKVKENTEKANKSLTEKVEKIELSAAKSAKKVRKHNDNLTTAVKQRDNHIRRLSGTSAKLADSIREKEMENKKLLEAHKEMVQNFLEAQLANKKLVDANAILVRTIKEFQEKLQSERTAMQKLQKLMADCKEEGRLAFEEIERLKERLKQLMKGPKDVRELARLQEKLREAREREQKYLDEQAYLDAKLKEMEENQEESGKKADSELDRMAKEHRKLQAKYEELMRTLQFTKDEHQKKIENMEAEFKSFATEMRAAQDKLLKEKEELQTAFDELTEAAIADRKNLEGLIKRTQQQDILIRTQLETIASRDEKIKYCEAQISTLKTEAAQLNAQIKTLEVSLKESQEENEETRRQLESVKEEFEKQKQVLAEKEKLIQEQMSKMKEMDELSQNLQRELRNSIDSLEQLKKENERLEESTKTFQGDKISVRSKLVEMESTVEELCKCTANNSGGDGGQQKLVNSLQQKIDVLEREAALKIELVQKQKEQAMKAAQFATVRLMETVCDFQDQVKTHKKVQYMLTKMLEDKEAELSAVCPGRCYSKKSIKSVKSAKSSKAGCSNPKCKNFNQDS